MQVSCINIILILLKEMNTFESSFFLFPMGIGSSLLLYLSSHNNETLIDNNSYNMAISLILMLAFIYFSTDFCLMILRYNPRNNIYFIHHMLGIISIPIVYFSHYYLIKYLLSYLTFELSTPILNIAQDFHKKKMSNIYTKIIEIIFFVVFTLVRVLFGTYLLFTTIKLLYNMDYPIKYLIIFPIILQSMNYYWYCKIISKFIKKYKPD